MTKAQRRRRDKRVAHGVSRGERPKRNQPQRGDTSVAVLDNRVSGRVQVVEFGRLKSLFERLDTLLFCERRFRGGDREGP